MAKDISKMDRRELLQVLLELKKENDRLLDENIRLQEQLEDKKVKYSSYGTLAEASLAINDMFKNADMAAKQYLDNVKELETAKIELTEEIEELLSYTARKCKNLLTQTKKKCMDMEEQTTLKCNALIYKTNTDVSRFKHMVLEKYPVNKDIDIDQEILNKMKNDSIINELDLPEVPEIQEERDIYDDYANLKNEDSKKVNITEEETSHKEYIMNEETTQEEIAYKSLILDNFKVDE